MKISLFIISFLINFNVFSQLKVKYTIINKINLLPNIIIDYDKFNIYKTEGEIDTILVLHNNNKVSKIILKNINQIEMYEFDTSSFDTKFESIFDSIFDYKIHNSTLDINNGVNFVFDSLLNLREYYCYGTISDRLFKNIFFIDSPCLSSSVYYFKLPLKWNAKGENLNFLSFSKKDNFLFYFYKENNYINKIEIYKLVSTSCDDLYFEFLKSIDF